MKLCKHLGLQRQEADFEVALTKGDKVYRRLKCAVCKARQQRERLCEIRQWLRGYKRTLACARCGFADWRALDFHTAILRRRGWRLPTSPEEML